MVIITGVAGAGKSTQCRKLENSGKFQWLSVGELLRNAPSQEVHDIVAKGIIIDDAITVPMVEAEIIKRNDTPELLLDGFPRTRAQAEWLLSKHATGAPFHISCFVHLTLSEEIALERLHKRGRNDDYDAAIARRFTVYEDVVLPIISFFDQAGIPTHEIDGDGSEDEVFNRIMELF